MKPLDFQLSWPPRKGTPKDALDATFANLRLLVGGENVTTYVDEDDPRVEGDHVEQPMLDVAGWIAENWWSLLWEAEKSEEARASDDYRFRHHLTSAQHGFALPNLRFIPTGDAVRLLAQPRQAKYADARFIRKADYLAPRRDVEMSLRAFMDDVVGTLTQWGEHPVADAWALVTSTTPEAAQFCILMGALGLSPYVEHRRIEHALEEASDKLSPAELLDLCLTSTGEEFIRSARVATLMHDAMGDADAVDLRRIEALSPPADPVDAPAYVRGYDAARKLRAAFGLDETDIDGATKVLEELRIDWRAKSTVELNGFSSPITGAIRKRRDRGSVAFALDALSSRRFAAARAAYMFWTDEANERRFLTNAVTRDQQASRAFAAELLVPKAYLRSHTRRSRMSWDQVNAIAERTTVSADVVKNQAVNMGMTIGH